MMRTSINLQKNCGPFLIFLLARPDCLLINMHKKLCPFFSGILQYSHLWFYVDLEMLLTCTSIAIGFFMLFLDMI